MQVMNNYRNYNRYSRYNVSRHGNNNANFSQPGNVSRGVNASQYSRNIDGRYSHQHIKKDNRKNKIGLIWKTLILIVLLGVIGFVVYTVFPINVKINGKETTLTFDKSMEAAIENMNIKVKPGNFVAVDFSVITPGQGEEYYAEVNGQRVNKSVKLSNGDDVTYTDGKDIMEDYDSVDEKISAKSEIKGVGAIHKFEGTGEPGVWSHMHGKVSGIDCERQTKDPSNVICSQYNIDTNKEKVIALTFDDGPNQEYTQQVLDLLKKYSAHATFFVIGERLEEKWAKNLVAKEEEEGHQVCTHTFDHARAVGGTDITLMSAEKQVQEVTKGKEAIAKAIKGEVSSVVRLPGGNLSPLTCRLIAPYVTAEIGWNIDTGDWEMPGSSVIYEHLELATAGDIILCHDGGGDRSETITALGKFLKDYSEKGFSFITIDELMKYNPAKQKSLN